MSWTSRTRASSARLARRHGGPAHLVVLDEGVLNPTTLQKTPTAVVHRISHVRTVQRAVKDPSTGLTVRSDRRTYLIAASDLPSGVDPRAPTTGRTYRILSPANNAAVTAANTAAKKAKLGAVVVSVSSRETAGEAVTVSLEVAA